MYNDNPQRDVDDPVISIGVLAERVGLSVSAIRRYESEGLILAARTPSGHRLYSHEDIDRVQNIRRMIQDQGLNAEGIRRIQALLTCWELLPCGDEDREACPAYRDSTRPCWMAKARPDNDRANTCRRCVVYRFGSLYTQETKRLLHQRNGSRDAVTSIREFLQRERDAKAEEG